jgi:dTDP-glucose pyrophosphorylase
MTYRWQNVLVSEDQPIYDALKVIDQEALRIALVVDKNNKLLGTVTDGDVRRGILRNLPFNSPVSEVMNSQPLTASENESKQGLLEKMKRLDLLSIPLINEKGHLVGLELLHNHFHSVNYDNPVFIMAGGFGKRLRPLTDNCPKPMLKVGDKPILETLILNFKKAGFHNFYISTHYLPEVIMDYFGKGEKHNISIRYVHEDQPLGTGGALGLLPSDLPDLPLLMINGDVLTTIDFNKVLTFHNKHKACATMCVREYEYQVPYGVIESRGNKITSMVEKPIQRFSVNAGIYIVGQEVLRDVKKGEHIDMPTLLEQKIAQGADILKYPVHEYWLDIGRMDDYTRAQADYHSLDIS